MWHPIERVAENRFLDLKITQEVATEFSIKLSIVDNSISTMNVDELIRLVRERQGDQTDVIRQREIARQQEKYRQWKA